MKAVIPAAGFGTRFLPIAKAVPKEMLPLGDRPVIAHVVAEAASAGFDHIHLVIAPGKESILRYFERDAALEARLEAAGKFDALQAIRQVACGTQISHSYQKEIRGLGDALLCAREFVGDDPFAVLLGDTVILADSPLPALAHSFFENQRGAVALESCPTERVSRYGVAGGREVAPGVFHLERMVEKPPATSAPVLTSSTGKCLGPHAFAARYFFPPGIFDFLERAQPGYGGEIQLTDAMEALRAREGMLGIICPGRRLDIGNPEGLAAAMPHFLKTHRFS